MGDGLDDLRGWRALAEEPELVSAASAVPPGDAAAITRLRRRYSAALVHRALSLAEARRRARAKWPEAEALWADPEGVEQATSGPVAMHKARRFAAAGVARALDLCSGVGADARALRAGGVAVRAIDANPSRAWMTRRNAECPAAAADVATIRPAGRPFHLDPARRRGGSRLRRLADLEPPPAVWQRLWRSSTASAIKLGPGLDPEFLPEPPRAEVEWISRRGQLVEAVLWTGALAGEAPRRATRIDLAGADRSVSGAPGDAPLGPLSEWIFALDPAVERAGLAHRLCAEHGIHAPHARLGLLTGPAKLQDPLLTPYRLLEQLPWRMERVRRRLRELEAGPVTVKTRGKAVDPDDVAPKLSGHGERPLTVFVLRWDRRRVALIAEP